ncbi:MAG: hypothetical protein M1340_09585 [Actinobacteria bacterium]|nr:hypothetical protein [Actinomycetota bacterium]
MEDKKNKIILTREDVLKYKPRNLKVRLRNIGTIELKYISINDDLFIIRTDKEEISDKEFVIRVLKNQAEKNGRLISKLDDKTLCHVVEQYRQHEKDIFNYYVDTGANFSDFRVALRTYHEKQIEHLKTIIAPAIRSAQETFRGFSIDFSSYISQSDQFQQIAKTIARFTEIKLGIIEKSKPFTSMLEQIGASARILADSLRPKIEVITNWVEQNEAIFQKFSTVWEDLAKQYQIGEKEGVRVLRKYKWFISPNLPLQFINEAVRLGRKRGRQDKAMNQMFIKYFADDRWANLERMVNTWDESELLKKRMKILNDCVKVVKETDSNGVNCTNAILPTLISQIDGALTDYLESKGVLEGGYAVKKTKFKENSTNDLTEPLNELAHEIFLNILFQKSQRGKPLETPFNFNRHKIMHGEYVSYGRRDYLIRAFMVLDLLANLQ